MNDIKDKKKAVASLIEAANSLDALGNVEQADKLTRQAAKLAEDVEEDADIEDSDAPVDSSDPFAKGFGKSFKNFANRCKKIGDASNLKKKLDALNEASGGKGDTRKIRNLLEELCDELCKICKGD